jgi:molybdate transport system permease protein
MFAHRTFPLKNVLRTLCVLPMVLPPVVGGVALIYAFGRRGLIGSTLEDWFGYRIAFTQSATVLAQFFVAAPFFIVVMESVFSQVDASTTWASRTLGAGPWRTLLTVNIPILWPSLVAGIVLTWARALGEFGATITFAGNSPGSTQPLPLAIYSSLESGNDAAVSLSFLMMVISFVVLISLRQRWMTAFQRGAA